MALIESALPAMGRDVAELSSQLDKTLQRLQANYGFPGATAAIALRDGTIVSTATGLADVESDLLPSLEATLAELATGAVR